MEKLKAALAFGGILAASDIDLLAVNFKFRQVKAGVYIEELHEVASEILFVESGILRLLGVDASGNEVTKHFIKEHQFFANLESSTAGNRRQRLFRQLLPAISIR